MKRKEVKKPAQPSPRWGLLHYWRWGLVGPVGVLIISGCVYAVWKFSPGQTETSTSPIPAAVVLTSQGIYLVDQQGILLADPIYAHEHRLIRIVGAVRPPSGRPGLPYGDPAVESAAKLAAFIAGDREYLGFASILIGTDRLEPDLRLATGKGTQVVWRRLGRGNSDGLSEHRKLDLLVTYCRMEGSLDQPSGPYRFSFDTRQGLLRARINTND